MLLMTQPPSATPLLDFRLHHVGYLVRNIPEAAQQWVSRFGYRVESSIIHDPQQTAEVQFLRQQKTNSWLELITPDSPASKLNSALERGGGLHHLCYEVDHLEQACAFLQQQAMLLVSAPVSATAFQGRKIAWLIDRSRSLIELLEKNDGVLSLHSIEHA